MKTTVGSFKTFEDARDAITRLETSGIKSNQINLLAKEEVLRNVEEDTSEGAGAGAVVGGIVGLLAGASAITIPGVGVVLTAGAIATTLGTTVVGAGLGGVVGALVDLGIPDDEANVYASSVREGQILVSVTGDENEVSMAEKIFTREEAVGIQTDTNHSPG